MSFREDQLQSNEKIVLQVNQHWVILMRPFLGALVSTVIFGTLAFYIALHWQQSLGYLLLLFLIPGYVRFCWRLIARAHEEYIVTNFRIVKQQGVFSKSSFDAPLEKINNVFHDQTVWGRMWNYGNVGLETASKEGTTLFRYIPNPVGFKNVVIAQQQAIKSKPIYVTTASPDDSLAGTQDIPALLQKLGQLRDSGVLTPEEFETKKRDLLSRM